MSPTMENPVMNCLMKLTNSVYNCNNVSMKEKIKNLQPSQDCLFIVFIAVTKLVFIIHLPVYKFTSVFPNQCNITNKAE